ncbi:hypothetical protein JEM67_21335 [Serratia sp. PAMC26656]|nr:hypothetical protein [Serratia sp. PAMC26656]
MFKPDDAEYGLLGRDPKGWGHLNAHLCYERVFCHAGGENVQ